MEIIKGCNGRSVPFKSVPKKSVKNRMGLSEHS